LPNMGRLIIYDARNMQITVLKSKIHRATITGADLNYEGSISIDKKLLEAANILPYELVQVVDINNGQRFETYAIEDKPGGGQIKLNGAAARLGHVGDLIIILSYATLSVDEAKKFKPSIVQVDSKNKQI
jgi:aspartate 1-decarboxylase